MSERITDKRVRFLASRVSGMRYGASGTQADDTTWDDTRAALTELLALRSEVERLRVVEKAARASILELNKHPCRVCDTWRTHQANCPVGHIEAALSATKQEPGT